MSCYWDVFCVDCSEHCGITDANHAVELMRSLIANRHALENLQSLDRVELKIEWQYIPVDFFSKHKGHRLTPRDEYGRLDHQCREIVQCSECGKQDFCVLDEGHDCPHSLKKS